jgi:hypothetical protein
MINPVARTPLEAAQHLQAHGVSAGSAAEIDVLTKAGHIGDTDVEVQTSASA